MPEQIGLVAELDLSAWDLAVQRYITSSLQMQTHSQSVASAIGQSYTQLGAVITTALVAATAAVAGLATVGAKELTEWTVEGVKDAAEFEQGVADIAAILRLTKEEADPLGDLINNLALDPQLVVGTEEATDAIKALAKNGVEMTDILDGAAYATVLLANSTGSDFKKSADIATLAMHMFNLEATDLNRVADISQGVINNSRIELNDWMLAMGNGGAVANTFGLSLEDVATATVATINNYHSARQAGTGLANFLLRTVPITQTAADEMRNLGIFNGLTGKEFEALAEKIEKTEKKIADLDPTSDNYRERVAELNAELAEQRSQLNAGSNAFFDAEGNLKSLAEVSEVLTNATKDLSDEQRIAAFRVIFGNDAMETALKLAEMGQVEFDALTASIIEEGSAMEAAATRTDTLAARWDNLGDIWEAIRRKSGAELNDTLREIVEWLTELTDTHGERVVYLFSQIGELFAAIAEKAMPWVEEQLPALIHNIEVLVQLLLDLVQGGENTEQWLDSFTPSWEELARNVVAVVETFQNFRDKVGEVWETIQKLLGPLAEWIFQNVELQDVLLAAAGAVAAFLSPLALAITRMAAVGAAMSVAIATIRTAWEEDWLSIRSTFEEIWPQIEGPIDDMIVKLGQGDWAGAWEAAKTAAVAALEVIQTKVPEAVEPAIAAVIAILEGDWATAWESAKEAVNNAVDLAVEKLEELKEKVPEKVEPGVQAVIDFLEGDWSSAWENAKTSAITAIDEIKTAWDLMQEGLRTAIQEESFPAWAEEIAEIGLALSEAFERLLDLIGDVFTLLDQRSTSETNFAQGLKFLSDDIQMVIEGFETLLIWVDQGILALQKFNNWIAGNDNSEVVRQMEENDARLREIVQGWGDDLPMFVEDGFGDMYAMTELWLGRIADKTEEQFIYLGDVIKLSGEESAQAFADAFQGGASDEALVNLQGFRDRVMEIAAAIEAGFLELGSSSVDELLAGFANKYGIVEEAGVELGNRMITATLDGVMLTGPLLSDEVETATTDAIEDAKEPSKAKGKELGTESIEAVGTGMDEGSSTATEAWQNVLDTIAESSEQLPEEMKTVGSDSVTELVTPLTEEGPAKTTEGLAAITEAVNVWAGELLVLMQENGLNTIGELVTAITENSPQLQEAFTLIQEQIQTWIETFLLFVYDLGVETVDEFVRGIQETIPNLDPVLEELRLKFETFFGELLPFMLDRGTQTIAEYVAGMVEGAAIFDEHMAEWRQKFEDWVAELLPYLKDRGIQAMAEFTAGLFEGQPVFEEYMQSLREFIETWMEEHLVFMKESGVNSITELTAGFEEADPLVDEYFQALKEKIETWFGEMVPYMGEQGVEMVTTMANEMQATLPEIEAVFEEMKQIVLQKIEEMITEAVALMSTMASEMVSAVDTSQFTALGENIGSSFAAGIQSQVSAVQAAAAELTAAAAVATETTAEIASPSKLFRRLGRFSGEGLVLGWADKLEQLRELISGFVMSMGGDLGKLKVEYGGGGAASALGSIGSSALGSLNSRIADIARSPVNNSSSYQTVNAPVQIGPVYINHQMDEAEFFYRVEQIVERSKFR